MAFTGTKVYEAETSGWVKIGARWFWRSVLPMWRRREGDYFNVTWKGPFRFYFHPQDLASPGVIEVKLRPRTQIRLEEYYRQHQAVPSNCPPLVPRMHI
jgi:hypothetical protein